MANPKDFVFAANGVYDFGLVDADSAAIMGTKPGPIRLQYGHRGWGKLHVEAYPDRMKLILQAGHLAFSTFAHEVAQNYVKVCEGNPKERFQLVYPRLVDGHLLDLKLIVEPITLDGLYFYSVITGILARIGRYKEICKITRKGGSVPAPISAREPRFETLSLPKASGGNGS